MRMCVHGLGYTGLATAALFANNGHEVIGYDTDATVRDRLRRGEPDVSEPELATYVERALDDELLISDAVRPADCHVICVPTPYDAGTGQADLTYIQEASSAVAAHLRADDLVLLESTVPPGTTTSFVRPLLERAGLVAGEDFGLAYAPETVLPGNTVSELRSNDRIVGGITDSARQTVQSLYESATQGTVHAAPSATMAEFVKLVQNAFRDVNIAFANELALLADDYQLDVRHAIELANTHPRVSILDPGPGVGGHCLPVDPHFLGHRSEETELVDCARQVNERMPEHVAGILRSELGTLREKTLAILGIAYKGNVGDTRNSPGLAVARTLAGVEVTSPSMADGGWGGVDVRLCDPRASDEVFNLVSLEAALDGADAAVITAAHDEFAALDPEAVSELLAGDFLVDTLGLLEVSRWRDHGINVVGI